MVHSSHILVHWDLGLSVVVPPIDVDVVVAAPFFGFVFGVFFFIVIGLILSILVLIVVAIVNLVDLLLGELGLRECLLVVISGVLRARWPKCELTMVVLLDQSLPIYRIKEGMTHYLQSPFVSGDRT